MEENTIKTLTFPDDIYVSMDAEGKLRLSLSDPLEGRPEDVDLQRIIATCYGTPDSVNTVKLRLKGALLQRGGEFNLTVPGKIRSGQMDAHIRDREGRVIRILEDPSADPLFPLQGEVVDPGSGKALGQRLFSTRGLCQDGDALHSLVTVNGRIQFSR